MLELLSFILSRLFLMPINIIVISIFLIPREYLALWNAGIIAIWAILLFPFNKPYVDGNFDFFADISIAFINFLLIMAIVALLANKLSEKGNCLQPLKKVQNRTQKIKLLESFVYGILAAYFCFLLLTKLWHNYQPAWRAYATIIAGAIVVIASSFSFNKHRLYRLKNISLFIYSFAITTIIILFTNLIFPFATRIETKKIIDLIGDRNLKYCIQSDEKPIDSWLYLTPLTAWNKPNTFFGGSGLRHAVLVIEKDNKHILYHWSYRQRKWEFTSDGFEPGAFLVPSSLKCTPKIDYLNKLPFWFS